MTCAYGTSCQESPRCPLAQARFFRFPQERGMNLCSWLTMALPLYICLMASLQDCHPAPRLDAEAHLISPAEGHKVFDSVLCVRAVHAPCDACAQ